MVTIAFPENKCTEWSKKGSIWEIRHQYSKSKSLPFFKLLQSKIDHENSDSHAAIKAIPRQVSQNLYNWARERAKLK